MEMYIGCKLISAKPMTRWDFLARKGRCKSGEDEDGYFVRYQDGYESWSPKNVFESAHLALPCNFGETGAQRITQGMVDGFINDTEVKTLGDRTTVVRATLRNGFEIVRSSSCVCAENYDEKLGAEICLGGIRDEVWNLLGFMLCTAKNGIHATRRAESCMSFGDAILAMKRGRKVARRGWNGKGMYLYYCRPERRVMPDSTIADGYPHIEMRAADGKIVVGWLASQTDMLSEDWVIVD